MRLHIAWQKVTNKTATNYCDCFPQKDNISLMFYLPSLFRQSHPVPAIKQKKNPTVIGFVFFICGGDEGGRTPYLLNAIQALYQLSYTPKADNKRKYTIFTSFCQLHLNKWVKCLEQIFCVFDTFAVRACTRCAHLIKDKHCLVLIIYILYMDIYYIRKVFYA